MSDRLPVDLRSDTVTRPTEGMRAAMARAEVGDDVYGEDPTVARLERAAAERLGFEASLFVPTGTMGNQIAIHLHTEPGTEVIVDGGCHVYNYELGAMAAWSGATPRVVVGEFHPKLGEVAGRVPPDALYYLTRPRLVVLESSHNHAGGRVIPLDVQRALQEEARSVGLSLHLDGARIFNAARALEVPAATVAAGFDSAMFCLSKGLGAPIGSVLCGDRAFVREARTVRKRLGGGMRQVGILAAAGLYALEHHVDRLGDDHARARRLAECVSRHPAFELDVSTVETNIVIASTSTPSLADRAIEALREHGVLVGGMGPGRVRFVTHLDVDDRALERFEHALEAVPEA